MTTFKAAIGICGLSQQAAAVYLDVSMASVKDWCRGKTPPPIGVWEMLAGLHQRIEAAADHASALIDVETAKRAMLANVQADNGDDPLPDGADSAAGALAVLLAFADYA